MKKIFITGLFFITFMSATHAQYRTERTGYEGDYFSLEGAIELFKEAHSIRDFERKINSKTTFVNNLDLNYDGRIDYIRVEHRRQGDFHAIILQIPLNKYELQDVAVIEIEKIGRRDAVLQIIGDEDLYGEEVIVEPFVGDSYASNRSRSNGYVNVYYWPVVQSIFDNYYEVYVSPYRWSYYPAWWSPWSPYSWNVYYPRIRNYYRYCHVVKVYRTPRVHRFYRTHRSYSHRVADRTAKVRNQRGAASMQRAISPQHRTRGEVYSSNSPRNRESASIENRNRVSAHPERTPSKIKPSGRSETPGQRSRVVAPDQSPNKAPHTSLNDQQTIKSRSSSKSQSYGARTGKYAGSTVDKHPAPQPQVREQRISPRKAPPQKAATIRQRSTSSTSRGHSVRSRAKDADSSTRKKASGTRSQER